MGVSALGRQTVVRCLAVFEMKCFDPACGERERLDVGHGYDVRNRHRFADGDLCVRTVAIVAHRNRSALLATGAHGRPPAC
jgi:hypothetical protein